MSVKKNQAYETPETMDKIVDGVLDIDEVNEVIPFTYTITSYGWDPQVDGLVKRMKEGNIYIPLFSLSGPTHQGGVRFQREYVWKKQQADRFIESLLLGLPVPGIFLVKEETGKHLVLDGHQRLKTLYSFFENDWEGGAFALESVQERFKNRTYGQLESTDRLRLDDAIVHATVIKQDEPSEDMSSIYLIFERLNSGGTSLHPQEIRVALYHGQFVQLLNSLNTHPSWRSLFGRKSKRLKDMELILRFFALLESKKYSPPMKTFLSGYMAHRRNPSPQLEAEFRSLFEQTTDAILRAIGTKAFKLINNVNAALVDALMVGVARRIKEKGNISDPDALNSAYQKLLRDPNFRGAISRATANEENVRQRLTLATSLISVVE